MSSPPSSPRKKKKSKEKKDGNDAVDGGGDGGTELQAPELPAADNNEDLDLCARMLRMCDLDHNDRATIAELVLVETVIKAAAELRPYDSYVREIIDKIIQQLREKGEMGDESVVTPATLLLAVNDVAKTPPYTKEKVFKAMQRAVTLMRSDLDTGVHLDMFVMALWMIAMGIVVFFYWSFQPWQAKYVVQTVVVNTTIAETTPPVQKLTLEYGGELSRPVLGYIAFAMHCVLTLALLAPWRMCEVNKKPRWVLFALFLKFWQTTLAPLYNHDWFSGGKRATSSWRMLVCAIFFSSGIVCSVWLLLLTTETLANPEFAFTSACVGYMVWLFFGAVGCVVGSTRLRAAGRIAIERERARLKNVPVDSIANYPRIRTAFDLYRLLEDAFDTVMAQKRARPSMRIFIGFSLFIMTLLPVAVWVVVDRDWLGISSRPDIVLTDRSDTWFTPILFALATVGSSFYIFSVLFEVSLHYLARDTAMELCTHMINPGPLVPYVPVSLPHNAMAWYQLRQFVLKYDKQELIERTNTATGMLLLMLFMFMLLFVITIPSGDAGLAVGLAYVAFLVSIFLFFILGAGVMVFNEQTRQIGVLQSEIFEGSVLHHKRKNNPHAEADAFHDVGPLAALIQLLEKTDQPHFALGIVPLKRSTLNGLRGLVLTLLTGGISIIGLDPFGKALSETSQTFTQFVHQAR